MHRMRAPSERTSLRKLDAAHSRGAASRPEVAYFRLTFSRNGIRFFTNAFFGLAELGSLCE
jgi:hypothetical protein